METIYRFDSFREVIRNAVESKQRLDRSFNFQKLAQAMGIQKSYLSQVLAGRAEINLDQAYLFCQQLELNEEQSQYFNLLVEHSRTGLAERKQVLLSKIKSIQEQKLATEQHLKVTPSHASEGDMTDYYLDAYNQLVHVCLSRAAFRKDPMKLAEGLGLHKDRLGEILAELQRLDMIRLEKTGFTVQRKNLHLPKESKVFKAWRAQLRAMALQKSLQSPAEDSYNFSVIVSCTEKVRRQLHEGFLEFLSRAQKLVNESEADHVYQMNFDLLKWI